MLTRRHPFSRTRCVLVTVASTVVAAMLLRELLRQAAEPVVRVDQALVRVCLAGLVATVTWAWLATLCVVAEAWRGRARHTRISAPVRRLVLLCCGVALATPVGHAAGDEGPSPSVVVAGLPFPDRATGPAHRPAPAPSTTRTVVVGAGDCLWHLAAADLPAAASDARIAAHWRAIHRLNAAVIGPDPDLIHPGQRLVLPTRPSR